jgi:hypothetical protein
MEANVRSHAPAALLSRNQLPYAVDKTLDGSQSWSGLYGQRTISYNGIYIYRLHNNLFIYTTRFDPNESSSGAFSYTSFAIELQRKIRTFT